jgi:hypothetical protein
VYGLLKLNLKEAQNFGIELARRWIASNYCGWLATGGFAKHDGPTEGIMFEKHDAHKLGAPGDGGEYDVQDGFGWSNGVLLSFLMHVGSNMTAPTDCPHIPQSIQVSIQAQQPAKVLQSLHKTDIFKYNTTNIQAICVIHGKLRPFNVSYPMISSSLSWINCL